MTHLNRRQFGAILLAGTQIRSLYAAIPSIGDALAASREMRGIPAVAAKAITSNKTLYAGGVGPRVPDSDEQVNADTIYPIASMTKPVTTVAAMQLVEQGRLDLDAPISRYLSRLAHVKVLVGFNAAGEPVLRDPKTPVTLRKLLAHTSGFSYGAWHEMAARYEAQQGITPGQVAPDVPLMFDPGTSWQYGYGADWAGKLVEAVANMSLEDYFQEFILQPLEMYDTSFIVPEEKMDRFVTRYQKQPNGEFRVTPVPRPNPTEFSGGGGLNSTANDYAKFMRMILRWGQGPGRTDILKARTVVEMSRNQIGDLRAGLLKSSNLAASADVDTHPGSEDRWGLGFLINPEPHEGGRSAGSLAWAGIWNTYFWIDHERDVAGVVMMQYLPFFDPAAIGVLDDFERSVYANL